MKIKIKYIKKSIIPLVGSGIVLLSGCGKTTSNETKKSTSYTNGNYQNDETITNSITTELTSEEYNEEIAEEQVPTTQEDLGQTTTELEEDFETEQQVIDFVDVIKSKTEEYVNTENLEKVKDKTIDGLVTLTDFIFYGTEIKGITFDELTDETKEIIMDSFSDVDELIMTKFPNYKETFKAKTGKAYDYVSEKVTEWKDKATSKLEEKLGSEKYDEYIEEYEKIKEGYHEAMDDTKEDITDAKEYVKKWYENKTGK